MNHDYDIIIIGAGPGGIYAAYEFVKKNSNKKIAIFESGKALPGRKCPIDGEKIKNCVHCPVCSIMCGFGGAGAYSDGKYNITNEFGGTLYEHIGKEKAIELMEYVDQINCINGGMNTRLYVNENISKKKFLQNDLHLLSAKVRHLGNTCDICIISTGRSGSRWMEDLCSHLDIETKSDRVDIGVRVELPAEVFSELTDILYESKIVYMSRKYQDKIRTFCMNPHGVVVAENTNGIVTVNGHSYEDPEKLTDNTNFALLVSNHFTKPFKYSNQYGESIARLSNMLGGGVLVQRFGDLVRGQRSTEDRIEKGFLRPTLKATPGDLSLVIPKRQLDDIIEMIYALDKICPGTANEDTLLYGVEVKFYNMEVDVDANLETKYPALFVIGDCSGVTHSLSHASASGVYVARHIMEKQ